MSLKKLNYGEIIRKFPENNDLKALSKKYDVFIINGTLNKVLKKSSKDLSSIETKFYACIDTGALE